MTPADKQSTYAAARREWWAMVRRVIEARLQEMQEAKRDD